MYNREKSQEYLWKKVQIWEFYIGAGNGTETFGWAVNPMAIKSFPTTFPTFSSGNFISIFTIHYEKYFSNQCLIKSLFVFRLYFDCVAYSRGWAKPGSWGSTTLLFPTWFTD